MDLRQDRDKQKSNPTGQTGAAPSGGLLHDGKTVVGKSNGFASLPLALWAASAEVLLADAHGTRLAGALNGPGSRARRRGHSTPATLLFLCFISGVRDDTSTSGSACQPHQALAAKVAGRTALRACAETGFASCDQGRILPATHARAGDCARGGGSHGFAKFPRG